jgi:hypothetical protein
MGSFLNAERETEDRPLAQENAGAAGGVPVTAAPLLQAVAKYNCAARGGQGRISESVIRRPRRDARLS